MVVTLLVCIPATCPAQPALQLKVLETVPYGAQDGSDPDRPSIAVRNDGLIRVAIEDFEPSVLKVATRDSKGNWTYINVANFGDQPTAAFLPNGKLGVTYVAFSNFYEPKLARVGDSDATTEGLRMTLPFNPSLYYRVLPWVVDSNGNLQVVSMLNSMRLKSTLGMLGWNSVALPSLPFDIVARPQGGVYILTVDGVYTYNTNLLKEQGVLTPLAVHREGNLAIDKRGRLHVAFQTEDGSIAYQLLEKGHAHPLETVASSLADTINHQSLVVDPKGRPYLIYMNSMWRLVVARRTNAGWVEDIDFGEGYNASMVLGPTGKDLHAAFAGSDGLIRYARIEITNGASPTSKSDK